MDNPVDHPFDLGLVNYARHPENNEYVVYRFADEFRANSFETALKDKGIPYETDTHEKKQLTYYLFGVHKNYYKQTEKINYQVEGQHRKPFIPFAGFRWFLILGSGLVLTLASIGYCKAQNKLKLIDEKGTSINSVEKVENK